MATSSEILSILRLLDEIGMTMGYVSGYLHDTSRSGELPPVLDPEEVRKLEEWRRIWSLIVKAKLEPGIKLDDEQIQAFIDSYGSYGDDFLDEYFTILELQRIPGVVQRWRKLQGLQVVLLRDEKVTRYLRQATTSYLYGLLDAAIILCRAVLEFALAEAFATREGPPPNPSGVDRRDNLKNLINSSREHRVLSDDLSTKAHRIRELGNKALHRSGCSESDALATMNDMGELLAHIFGRIKKSPQ